MYKIKFGLLISIIVLSYIIGCCMGFALSASSQKTYAAPKPNITNVQNVQGVNYKYEVAYINGSKYIIFSNMSGSDIEVIK